MTIAPALLGTRWQPMGQAYLRCSRDQLHVPLTHDEPAPQSPSDEHGDPVAFA